MTVDDVTGPPVHEHLLDLANLAEDARDGLLLRLRMDAPVRRISEQLVRCLVAGAHDP